MTPLKRIEFEQKDGLVITEAEITHAIVRSRNFRAYRNAMCILLALDEDELVAAGVIGSRSQWYDFQADKIRFVLRLDDERSADLWRLIQARQPAELRASESLS